MGKPRTALGRGLDALIPNRTGREWLREIPLDNIIPNSNQPRHRFPEDALSELSESIRQHGVLQPLIVTSQDEAGKHQLIVGERRWQAAKLAGLETVPAIERESTPQSALEIALIENLQRQDLDPLEEAAAFERLIDEYGLTQEDVALRVGRSRPAIANALRLLRLPPAVKEAMLAGDVTEGHARALLGVSDPLIVSALLARIREHDLTVRQTEALVAEFRTDRKPRQTRKRSSPEIEDLENRLRASLGTKVSIRQGRKASRIVIEYYSPEDLEALLERLLAQTDASEGSEAFPE